MALTVTDLAAALRIGDGATAPEEPIHGVLVRLLEVADAFITERAADAPEAVQDEARIRFAAYLYDAPFAGLRDGYAHGWTNSGAAHLVSPWTSERLGITS